MKLFPVLLTTFAVAAALPTEPTTQTGRLAATQSLTPSQLREYDLDDIPEVIETDFPKKYFTGIIEEIFGKLEAHGFDIEACFCGEPKYATEMLKHGGDSDVLVKDTDKFIFLYSLMGIDVPKEMCQMSHNKPKKEKREQLRIRPIKDYLKTKEDIERYISFMRAIAQSMGTLPDLE
ncbi:hypothetical protein PUMCH_001811 [Australozyma saopauloensis]|uniref:Uncharacterized protein n=1 Tax=Australozyma saopauloensis TaxID=291208 RepID=A0AAX4H7H6_9ASCO|nr:hypothetical protein PUMCH_001811 [[Candida] saopauloensis]